MCLTLGDILWMAAFRCDKHFVSSRHLSAAGLSTPALLLAPSPRPGGLTALLDLALLQPRIAHTEVSTRASDLQKAELAALVRRD